MPCHRSAILAYTSAVLCAVQIHADEPVPRSIQDGLSLQAGTEQVEVRVVSPHAFCLSVHDPAAPRPAGSIYLSGETQSGTSFQVVREGGTVGLAAAFGKLMVDPDRGMWSLRDAAGRILADWTALGKPVPGPALRSAAFRLSIGPGAATARPLYYGSGSNPDLGALTQESGHANTGNGTAMLPQYWSTAGYGVLLIGEKDNAPGSWRADASGRVDWEVPGNGADLYLCPTPDLYAWLRADAELTGFAPVPARWTFGYLQSQWGWKDKTYLDDTLTHFRQGRFPVDAFIIDFEWYTTRPDYNVRTEGEPDFADFGWNPRLFPDPPTQIADFARQGLHLVGIRKPRLGNSENLKMARAKGWILPPEPTDPNGEGIRTRNLDYSRPEVRAWWARNNRQFFEDGMAGFWNDEGESNYIEYTEWNLAEVALQQQVQPAGRFWSLNRSFIPGMQRLGAAVWTGDIAADWPTLARTPGEMLSYGLAGMPYSACDIGGFGGDPTPELLTRWMQAGVFFPIMRAHSEINKTPRFPWLFGPAAEAAVRKALELRYRLMPYYYSLSHENHVTAAPLMRPLAMEFPDDEKAATLSDEWLLGKGLLAAPILKEGGERSVYLPKDRWFDFGSTHATDGARSVQVTAKLDEVPVYVRAGTLLPLGPVVQSTGQPSSEPLEMQIYGGRDATFDLVEDDGETSAYQQGVVRVTHFTWNEQTQQLTWKVTGNYQGERSFPTVRAVLFSPRGQVEKEAPLGRDGAVSFP